MNHPKPSSAEEFLYALKTGNEQALIALYDQYAPILLGIINKILHNEAESFEVLADTFIKIRLRINELQLAKQPLFAWLVSIARCTALDAIKNRLPSQSSTFQINKGNQVVSLPSKKSVTQESSAPNEDKTKLNEFLDAVLFKNCTPEEAASSFGIPVETARQYLRLAMQQLRISQMTR